MESPSAALVDAPDEGRRRRARSLAALFFARWIVAAQLSLTAVVYAAAPTWTGGDEFTLILPDCDAEVAVAVVRRLLDHPVPNVSCSAGVAVWDGKQPVHQLVQRADDALRSARTDGPLVVAEGSMDAVA